MMSIFPATFYDYTPAVEASFTPLFRLLDDFDAYTRQMQRAAAPNCCPRHLMRSPRHNHTNNAVTTFNPRFDVCETETAYELHGELPGLERENVSIEFVDPQTLVVKGRIERGYEEGSPEGEEETNDTKSGNTAAQEMETPRRNSFQATVEDDPEDPHHTPAPSPKTVPADAAPSEGNNAEPKEEKAVVKKSDSKRAVQKHNGTRYWLWERSVGEFQRVFAFPERLDHDGVTARLENGILSVNVPKAKKAGKRKIEIQ